MALGHARVALASAILLMAVPAWAQMPVTGTASAPDAAGSYTVTPDGGL